MYNGFVRNKPSHCFVEKCRLYFFQMTMLVIKIKVIVDCEQIELYDCSKYSFVFAQVISQISRNVTRNK